MKQILSKVGDGNYAVPASYLIALQEFAAERGVAPHDFLCGTGIPLRALLDPSLRIGSRSIRRALGNLLDRVDDAMVAIDHAQNQSIAEHGVLGFAAKHSETLADAARLVVQYSVLSLGTEDAFELVEKRDSLALRLHVDGFERADVARFHALSTLVNLDVLGRRLVGSDGEQVPVEISIAYPPPSGELNPNRMSPGLRLRFDQVVNELSLPIAHANRKILRADHQLADIAIRDCETERIILTDHKDAAAAVRLRIRQRQGATPTIDIIAAELFMSPRTLKRRLKDAGTSYRKIKDSERFRKAIGLLDQKDANLEAIAHALGYSDASNFSKAFKTWTGETPGVYRAKL